MTVGQKVRAKVVQPVNYGVWFDFEGTSILVLISDLGLKPGKEMPQDRFKPGDEHEVKILLVTDDGKVRGTLL